MKLFVLLVLMTPLAGPGEKQEDIEPKEMRQLEQSLDDCLASARKILLVEPVDIGMKNLSATCTQAEDVSGIDG